MYDMRNLAKFKNFGELVPEAFKAFVAFDAVAFKAGGDPRQVQGADGGRGGADDTVPVLHRDPPPPGEGGGRHRTGTG